MLESLLVALIVSVAAVYAAWALTPAGTRNRLALRASAAIGGPESSGWRAFLAARLQSLVKNSAAGCGNCSAHSATPAERAARKGGTGR